MTVNEELRSEKKNFDALTLSPLRRLIISMNDDPSRMQVLPPLDDDIADKIMLFKIAKHPMPMPTGTPQEKQAFWNALESEMPMFIHFLNDWEIPVELRSERFGIIQYHHPDLADALNASSPEQQLLTFIETELLPKAHGHPWKGSAAEMETALSAQESSVLLQARRLLVHNNSCGT